MKPEILHGHAASRCAIVIGMHRSGTSLTAGLLAAMGVDMGAHLVPADRQNPRGYFEDIDIVRLHQRAFRSRLSHVAAGHPDWGWTPQENVRAEDLTTWRPEARLLVERRAAAGRLWGFKDPRTTVVADFWDSLIPEAAYVCVYRDPSMVASSMQRLGAPAFLSNPGYAWSIWNFYNRRLVDFVRLHRDRCLLLNFDALGSSLEALPALIRDRLGLHVAQTHLRPHYQPGFATGPLGTTVPPAMWRRVWEDSAALFDELESLADLPAFTAPSANCGVRHLNSTQPADSGELSIVIATHNDAALLVEALASAEACTRGRHEILVIDDGTTDPESLRILERLRAAGRPILKQPQAGVSAARNSLIRAAGGRYILPLDADNRLCPGFIERALAAFRGDPGLGVVYGEPLLFGQRTGRLRVPDFDLRSAVYRNDIDACAMFRRDLWADVGGYDESLTGFEDWEFWMHAGKRGWRFLHLPGIAFEYRVSHGSLLARCSSRPGYRAFRRRIWQRHADLLLAMTPAAVRTIAGVAAPFPRDIRSLAGWQSLVLRGHWHLAWALTALRKVDREPVASGMHE